MTTSLKAARRKLPPAHRQLEILEDATSRLIPFESQLKSIGQYPLKPTQIEILQINLGKMCNQTCAHCHVDAGPDRKEIMTWETMQLCLDAITHAPVHTIDLTGGAPELNPEFQRFVEEISGLGKKIIVRSNLTILVSNAKFKQFPEFFRKHKLTVIASLPCYTKGNTDKQRGVGVFDRSIDALKMLNALGYGKPHSGLELHLVYNPVGAVLAGNQQFLQADYKRELEETFGIQFNNLYTITNLPISRFLDFLLTTGKYEMYMETLVNAFNPATVTGVMCRNTVSVGWDGYLYDCDFNQMLELKIQHAPQHIRDFDFRTLSQRSIVVNQHCYGCTAGAGSSCQGAIL